jgi:hypothetical protein
MRWLGGAIVAQYTVLIGIIIVYIRVIFPLHYDGGKEWEERMKSG